MTLKRFTNNLTGNESESSQTKTNTHTSPTDPGDSVVSLCSGINRAARISSTECVYVVMSIVEKNGFLLLGIEMNGEARLDIQKK